MSNLTPPKRKPVTPTSLRSRKSSGQSIAMVTAYDYPFARCAELAGIDIIFVSDALASVGLGLEDTLSVTIDDMVYHTKAVKRATESSLLLAAMPFLSYTTAREAVTNAGRLVKEGGADAIELEGCADLANTVHALSQAGIAVVAHVGLTRKIASRTGSYRTQGQDAATALAVVEDALALADAGAFAVVLECVPDRVAAIVTSVIDVPTIGIGAGPYCDGQALVTQDMLGLYDNFTPKFVEKYAHLGKLAAEAFVAFKDSIASRSFPAERHTTGVGDDVLGEMLLKLGSVRAP